MNTNHKLKQLVWVCGGAASGKERLITRVVAGKEPGLCQRFGWLGETPVVSRVSLDYVGRHPGDTTITDQRDAMINEVGKLAKDSEVILIKEQRVDLRAKRPQRLQALYPSAQHILIILECTDANELMSRYNMKPFALDNQQHVDLTNRFKISLGMLADIKGFKTYALDSSKGKGYTETLLPTELIH